MARKVGNNVYSDDSNTLTTALKTGATATAGYYGYKYRKEIKDYVAPYTNYDSSPYMQRIDAARTSIFNVRGRADAMREMQNRYFKDEAKSLVTKANFSKPNINSKNITQSGSETLKRLSFQTLSDVVDSAGNDVGNVVLDRLNTMHGGDITFSHFNGTQGVFNQGKSGVTYKVPFAKFDKQSGGWLVNAAGSTYAAPTMAETTREGSSLGIRLQDFNTWLADNLDSKSATGKDRSLFMANSGFSQADVLEMKNKNKISSAKAAIYQERISAGKLIQDLDNVFSTKQILKNSAKQLELVSINDIAKMGRHNSVVKLDPFSRLQVANHASHIQGSGTKVELPGFESDVITSRFISGNLGDNPKVTGAGVSALYRTLPEHIRDNPGAVTVKTINGIFSASSIQGGQFGIVGQMALDAPANFAFTGSQEQIAKGNATIRRSPHAVRAEMNKSEKGIYFGMRDKAMESLNQTYLKPLGIKPGNYNKLRNSPSLNMAGFEGVASAPAQNLEYLYSSLTYLDPFSAETIAFDAGTTSRMETSRFGSLKLNTAANVRGRGSKEYNATYKFMYKGKMQEKNYPATAFLHNKRLRGMLDADPNSKIIINEGVILGTENIGAQALNASDTASYMGNPDSIVRAPSKMVINRENMNLTEALVSASNESNIPGKGFKISSEFIEAPNKMSVFGASWRSSMHRTIDSTISSAVNLAHPGIKVESTMSTKILGKVVPKNGVIGKGSPEFLTFLQNSAFGHMLEAKAENRHFRVRKTARTSLKGILDIADITEMEKEFGVDLPSAFAKGRLKWAPMSKDPTKLGHQLTAIASLVSGLRSSAINSVHYDGTSRTTLEKSLWNKSKNTDGMVDYFFKSWQNFADSDTTAQNLKNVEQETHMLSIVHGGRHNIPQKELNKLREKARKNTWAMWNQYTTSEHQSQSLGRGFNNLRLSLRDMPSLADSPGVLGELFLSNINNSVKMQAEVRLMEESWNGTTKSAAKAHENLLKTLPEGSVIPTYTSEEVNKMMGGGGKRWYQTLKKNKSMMAESIFSTDVNKNGFFVADHGVEGTNSAKYFGSAEMFRGSYMMTEEESTLHSFAKTLGQQISAYSDKPGNTSFTPTAREIIRSSILAEGLGSSKGFAGLTGLNSKNALISKHVEDTKFLHNWELNKALESPRFNSGIAGDLKTVFGNMVVMPQSDYLNVLKQDITDHARLSMENPGSTVSNIFDHQMGEGNFYSKYSDLLGTSGEEAIGNIDNITRRILDDQIDIAHKVQGRVSGMIHGASEMNAANLDEVQSLLHEGFSAFTIRHPNTYVGSPGLVNAMPDVTGKMGLKEIALGWAQRILKDSDTDGDPIGVKVIHTAAAKQETRQRILGVQKEAAKWMAISADKGSLAALKQASVVSGMTSVAEMEATAKVMLRDMPYATAMAAYFTKALTGNMNIKAMQAKNILKYDMDNVGISSSNITSAEAFFGSTISRFTENAVISSKQIQQILGGENSINSVTDLIGASFGSVEGREAIRRSVVDGLGVHPGVMMGMMGGNIPAEARELEKALETTIDLMTHYRPVSEMDGLHAFKTLGFENPEEQWSAVKAKALELGPTFTETDSAKALGLDSSRSYRTIMAESLNEYSVAQKGALASDSLSGIIPATNFAVSKGLLEEGGDAVVNQSMLSHRRRLVAESQAMLMNEGMGAVGPERKRMMRGWPQISKFISEKVLSRPGRIAGIAAAGILGVRALNMISGDGSPQDPSDLPSYANPSFEGRSYQTDLPRSIAATPAFDSNVSLLTSNDTSHGEAVQYAHQNNLASSSGNSVSIRHDGHNPYKSDMMLYE